MWDLLVCGCALILTNICLKHEIGIILLNGCVLKILYALINWAWKNIELNRYTWLWNYATKNQQSQLIFCGKNVIYAPVVPKCWRLLRDI